MKKIYLDNAGSTPVLPEVLHIVTKTMENAFGNPSSTHQQGRKAKAIVENSRKNIASYFNAASNEIIFTSSGTEGNNLILKNAVENLGVTTVITSKIEHKSVLNTLIYLQEKYAITVLFVEVNQWGVPNLLQLKEMLSKNNGKKLVSLMYVNNEIGTILEVEKITALCKEYEAYFHTDAVQAVGHFKFNASLLGIDFFTASAHKFHGTKGVGFIYFRRKINAMQHGGNQEKGIRAGTENVHSIAGMDKALTIAYENLEEDTKYIQKLKSYFIQELKKLSSKIEFNGNVNEKNATSYTILNVRFPKKYNMLLFNLDLKGIAASGGSACQSGATKGSYVLKEILSEKDYIKSSVRFSFSKFTTKEDVDFTVSTLKEILKV